jgi:hypothetical protein
MLLPWLSVTPRATTAPDVVDLDETELPCPHEVLEGLVEATINNLSDSAYLKEVAGLIGWTADQITPTVEAIRRGDFGEILATCVLEELEGLTIPVRKLRFKVVRNQTLPGNDIVGFQMRGEEIGEVWICESKLRTGPDADAIGEAHSQLIRARERRLPEILDFVGRRLFSEGPRHLSEAFVRYLGARDGGPDRNAIMAVWEREAWRDDFLTYHPEADQLALLKIHIIKLTGLADLIEVVYSSIDVALADPQ